MTIGEKLYLLRNEKKLSQERLAEMINVTRQTISNWELDRTQPNPEQLKLLSQTFNISIDELLDNSLSIKNTNEDSSEEVIVDINEKTEVNHNIYKVISIILGVICSVLVISLVLSLINNIEINKGSPITTVIHTGEPKYIVVYNPDNGEDLIAFTVHEGAYLHSFIPPEKEGYVFAGWYYKGKRWTYSEDRVYENITLVAHWEEISI